MVCWLCLDSLTHTKSKKKQQWVLQNIQVPLLNYIQLAPLLAVLMLAIDAPARLYWIMLLVGSMVLLELIPLKPFPLFENQTVVGLSSHFMGSAFPAFLATFASGIFLWCIISLVESNSTTFVKDFTSTLLIVGPIVFGTSMIVSRYFSE